MKITFILPQPGLSGGIRVIAIYAERLKRRGHDVLVVHPPNAQPSIRERARSVLHAKGWPRVPYMYPSHLDGLDVPRKILDRWRPVSAQDVPDADVVIATWWETAEWVSALPPGKGAKAYFIQHYEIHDNQPVERVKKTWSLPFHKIVVARWLADIARDLHGDTEVSLVPNSVDLDAFNAPEREKRPLPTVGFMHAHVPWKGADLACEAVRIARQSLPKLECVSFGMHGPTPAHPVPENTRFTLLPGPLALRGIYAQCDAWIVASRSEGFGLPILESMACRTPVIATPTGAAPELVGQGGGVLVDRENPRAIADAILRIAGMGEAQWKAMSDRAHETARGYTWDDATNLFEKALQSARAKADALARPHGGGAADATRRREARAWSPLDASFLVPVVMFGWPLVLLALFLMMPARRAVITGLLVAWLFLPVAEYEFKGIPEYNKMTATSLSLFIATLLFEPNRVLAFRPKWLDVPVLVLCVCPMASSLSNGLGLYDGMSESNSQLLRWGLPYFIGRIYFNDYQSMRELAFGIFLGGLIYLPFCWFEMRMSPQLHRIVYGYHQHGFMQTIRYGGYRPMVFLQHGLMVGMWMVTATLAGLALWQTGVVRQIRGIPMWALIALLFVTTIMCRSSGAIVLLGVGIAIFLSVRYMRTSLALPALAAICILYVSIRASGMWDGSQLVDLTKSAFGAERAQSVETRFYNEEALAARARQQPLFGWGGWGRSRIHDVRGKDVTITDSLWIITFGTNGVLGVAALLTAILLPPLFLFRKAPTAWWVHPTVAPVACMAVVALLWMTDNLLNAMFNPVYVVMIGGLAGMRPLSQTNVGILRVSRIVRKRFIPRRKRGKVPQPRPRVPDSRAL